MDLRRLLPHSTDFFALLDAAAANAAATGELLQTLFAAFEIPETAAADLRERVAAIVDGGELPGAPSTVLDFTGVEPRVLREGAAPGAEALARVRDALA